jgi:hypothetical protein
VSDFESTTITIDDVRAGDASDLLAQADVVIAVDVAMEEEEEVILGSDEWELASDTGQWDHLVVVRVELEMHSGDLEWLIDLIDAMNTRELGTDLDDVDDDDED